MSVKRIIPCLDTRDGRVVKGKNFVDIKDIDDPVALARYYNAEGADELVFYDITASVESRPLFLDLFERVAREVSIPLAVGGNISTVDDIERVLKLGANKVSINTGAINDPELIGNAAKRYGSQCVVLAMDVSRVGGEYHVFTKGGSADTGKDAIEWALYGENHGACELVINSIDTDGVREGFDLELLDKICRKVSIPVIASGGAGCIEHFVELFKKVPAVDAGLAASVFHLKEVRIAELKARLRDEGIEVRSRER